MIRFVKIVDSNGCSGPTFNGEAPFVHWIEGPRSTNIWHHQRICFISDKENLRIELGSTDVFKILDLHEYSVRAFEELQKETINGFKYNTIQNIFANGTGQWLVQRGYHFGDLYVYNLYLVARSEQPAEYVEDLIIDGVKCKVGIDIYEENEPLYVNMSNNNIEIPDAVQKAIYPVNVHEDSKDNGVLNIKFKELLSNYWDIAANKGSYKSLFNSLKWFEWGDLIRMREVWSHVDAGREIFRDADINELMNDVVMRMLADFRKTTYLTLSVALQSIKRERVEQEGTSEWEDIMRGLAQFTYQDKYDEEWNPELDYISALWSYDDIALKLCLLGNFYETYFMPIHLELIRCTIEEIVFTNTIKIMHGACTNREDFINNTRTFRCSVKNDSVWPISNVDVQVGPRTILGNKWYEGENWGDVRIVGCDPTANITPEREAVKRDITVEVWEDGRAKYYRYIYVWEEDPNTLVRVRREFEELIPYDETYKDGKLILHIPGAYVKITESTSNEGKYVLDVNEDGTPIYYKDEKCTIAYTDEELQNNPGLIEGAHKRYLEYRGENVNDRGIIPDIYLKTFATQMYTGPGVAIPFDCEVDLDAGDFITSETVMYIHDNDYQPNGKSKDWITNTSTVILDESGGLSGLKPYTRKFRFYLLFTKERDVELFIQLNSAGGKTYTKHLNIKVVNAEGQSIKIYKIRHKTDPYIASDIQNQANWTKLLAEWSANDIDISKFNPILDEEAKKQLQKADKYVSYELYDDYNVFDVDGKQLRGIRGINDAVFTRFRVPYLNKYGNVETGDGLVGRNKHTETAGWLKGDEDNNSNFTTWPLLVQYLPVSDPKYYAVDEKGQIQVDEDGTPIIPDMEESEYQALLEKCGPLISSIVVIGCDATHDKWSEDTSEIADYWYMTKTFHMVTRAKVGEDGIPILDENGEQLYEEVPIYHPARLGDHYYIIPRAGRSRNYYICIAKHFGDFKERYLIQPWDDAKLTNQPYYTEEPGGIDKTFGGITDGETTLYYVDQIAQNGFNIERNDWGYIPQFHYLEEIGLKHLDDVGELVKNRTIDDFTFEDTDVLVIIPEFLWSYKIGDANWGDLLDNWEWKLINATYDPHGEGTVLPSVRDPFVIRKTQQYLQSGYYDVVFRYRFVESVDWNELRLDSAFVKRINK